MSYDYYDKYVKGIRIDPYRVDDLYGNLGGGLFQALKKIMRSGAGQHKDKVKDITEARDALNRWLEMQSEDIS